MRLLKIENTQTARRKVFGISSIHEMTQAALFLENDLIILSSELTLRHPARTNDHPRSQRPPFLPSAQRAHGRFYIYIFFFQQSRFCHGGTNEINRHRAKPGHSA